MRSSFSPPPPPLSSTASTFGTRVPRSVVTSLALHGHAKPGEDGVRVKMYLKVALTAEHTTMGLVPLFPEANSIRILQYAVHPLDSAGAPYAGGPKTNRLLKRASRALQLPPESNKSYLDALVMSPGAGYNPRRANSIYQSAASPSSASPLPPLDIMHTGSIQVSNYAVCFVLPKLWPRVGAESESDDVLSRSTPFSAKRRSSVGSDKKSFRFMAAIEIFVPYLSTPPESPYLLSIPLPKCLSNKLQLKIFGPPQSDPAVDHEDAPRWDVTTDPVVQHRNSSLQLPASSRYGHVADDEDFSDASETNVQTETGLVVIQGAFPSTDRLRIRWAPALNADTLPLDGWQRASCSRVDGKLRLTVLEALRDPESPAQCNALRLGIEYTAECRGVVHPGVATRLAMDVMLDSRGQAINWAYPSEASPGGRSAATWNVISDKGLLGFDAGGQSPSTPQALSRRTSSSSFDSASVPGSPASLDGSIRARKSSIPVPAGPASLLNVPLPLEAGSDYSFEAQPHRTSSMSSSVMSSATGISQLTSDQDPIAMSTTTPAHRLSLHIDMDEILPRSPQEGSYFSYSINGVVDVKMRMQPNAFSSESSQTDDDPMGRVEGLVELPAFHTLNVPEADEHIQITVVSNVAGIMLSSGASPSSVGSRNGATKRQLRMGIPIACSDGAQLSLKQAVVPTTPTPAHKESTYSSVGSPRSPNGALPTDSMQLRMPKLPINGTPVRREDSDPLSALDTGRSSASPSVTSAFDLITSVDVHVELLPAPATQMRAHRVRVRIPAASIDTSRLEFALRTRAGEEKDAGGPLEVRVIYASVGGRPVETKVLQGAKPEPGAVALSEGADATWVTVFLGSTTGAVADIEVLYTVTQPESSEGQAGDLLAVIPPEGASCAAVLPYFYPSVGFMRVEVQEPTGYRIRSFDSNMQSDRRLGSFVMTRHALPCKFMPQLSMSLVEESALRSRNWTGFLLALSWLITAFALYTVYIQHAHIQDLHALVLGPGAVRPAHLRYVGSSANVVSGTATTPGHIHMPTFKIPPMREREHPAPESEQQQPAETGLSVVQRVRHSLSLRPDDLRNLLAAFPTTTAAAQALSNFLTHAMKLLRRVMHFPLPVED
ncbi:hypothetical protein AURDEDRAFT_180704 [Auricularia subglabra TFB-10046 SS5]|nr:hypothetical protein AURDEDRAFT_180704 [Auricularia subglabra TFB-10046 SS5]